MAVTVGASGTQTTVIGSEHVLDTETGAGVFVLYVDTGAMIAGDLIEVRIKEPVLSAGTTRILHYDGWQGAQPTVDVLKVSVPVASDSVAGGLVFTLKQVTGSARAYPWRVNLIA